MAKYNFYCKNCNYEFLVEQSIYDKLPTDCPNCKTLNSLLQNYGATTVLYKGSGFYVTDSNQK